MFPIANMGWRCIIPGAHNFEALCMRIGVHHESRSVLAPGWRLGRANEKAAVAKSASSSQAVMFPHFAAHRPQSGRIFLLLANFGKEGRPEPIVGKFSQEMLAEMIGTTRSRVSFFMNKFRKLGFIEYNGKLEVHNSLLNVVLHHKPEIKHRP